MEKKEIIDKYEFDEVVSGHMIMSEPDLYNIMDLWAEECLEEKLEEMNLKEINHALEYTDLAKRIFKQEGEKINTLKEGIRNFINNQISMAENKKSCIVHYKEIEKLKELL